MMRSMSHITRTAIQKKRTPSQSHIFLIPKTSDHIYNMTEQTGPKMIQCILTETLMTDFN